MDGKWIRASSYGQGELQGTQETRNCFLEVNPTNAHQKLGAGQPFVQTFCVLTGELGSGSQPIYNISSYW